VKEEQTLPFDAEHVPVSAKQLQSWSATVAGAEIVLTGPCPRCDHPAPNRVPLHTVALEVAGGSARQTLTAALACTCTEPHPGRPAGTPSGCGCTWTVVVTSRPDGALELAVPAPGPQSQLLAEAAEALRQATPRQLADLRSAGEKWIAGITALYGLLGFASLTGARDSIVKLSTGWQVAVAVTMLVAVCLAALAIYWAYRAAYGWPKTRLVRNDKELLAWYEQQVSAPERAAAFLRTAVGCAGASLGALVVLTGLLWFAPQASH
jgi:hypothetical protein